jgi:hypothetical protein
MESLAPQTTKPRASVERLREASNSFEGFQPKCHLPYRSRKFCQPAEEIRRALCAVWPASTVREEPRRPDAGCESRKGGLVQPRRYVSKTLDASTRPGKPGRHCERDRSMLAMRSGRLKRRARLKGQKLPARPKSVTLAGLTGLGVLRLLSGSELRVSLLKSVVGTEAERLKE